MAKRKIDLNNLGKSKGKEELGNLSTEHLEKILTVKRSLSSDNNKDIKQIKEIIKSKKE